VDAAGGVLHDEQDVKPVQQQGIDAEKVGGENAVGLGRSSSPWPGAAPAGAIQMPWTDLQCGGIEAGSSAVSPGPGATARP
jgi:hypothetical protein